MFLMFKRPRAQFIQILLALTFSFVSKLQIKFQTFQNGCELYKEHLQE